MKPPKLFLTIFAVPAVLLSHSSAFATDKCWHKAMDESTPVLEKIMALQEQLETLKLNNVDRKALTCQYWNARINYSQLRVKAARCPYNSDEILKSWNNRLQDDTNSAIQNGCIG